MSSIRKSLGSVGEEYAAVYLQKQGYSLLTRNFRTRNGEIDIIAIDISEKPSVLCFIEVKTRTSEMFGSPFEAIGYHKKEALIRTAELYKATHRGLPDGMRIDAVAVQLYFDHTLKDIQLVKNIG